MITVTTKLKYLHISPRKTRLAADLVRGLTVNDAEAELMLTSRRASYALLKLLHSAIANAKHNYKLDPNSLYIKDIHVDQGSKTKRWMPRARGGVSPVERKTSHVTLILAPSLKPRPPKFTIREKPKKEPDLKKADKKKVHKQGGKPKEPKVVSESKPVKKPGFFQRVFRRKSI